MILLRELLRGEFVELDHLLREGTRIDETFSKQHDLSNQAIVRDHHGHWSEEHFQVVWQLGSPCVTRIHGDEYSTSWEQGDNVIFK